jgi:hypothetical protein
MRQFLQHHGEQILGVLSGFDRLPMHDRIIVSSRSRIWHERKSAWTLIAGFRNRDIRQELYGAAGDECERRRQAARVTRKLAMLRAHGLIKKIPHTHRYILTTEGVSTIRVAARRASLTRLTAHKIRNEKTHEIQS